MFIQILIKHIMHDSKNAMQIVIILLEYRLYFLEHVLYYFSKLFFAFKC